MPDNKYVDLIDTPAAAGSDNPYVSLIDQERVAVKESLRQAQPVAPDAFAKSFDLSAITGIPVDVVDRNREQVESDYTSNKYLRLLDDSPATRSFLSNPDNAKVAHDDVENLSLVERGLRTVFAPEAAVLPALRSFAAGFVETPGRALSGLGSVYEAAGRSLARPIYRNLPPEVSEALAQPLPWWLDPAQILQRPGEVIKGAAEDIAPAQEDQNFVTDVAGGVGQMAAQITAAILSGGVASAVSTSTLVGQGADMQSDMVAESGAEPSPQTDAAIIGGGAITALTERYGLDAILNRIPNAMRSRIMRVLASAGSEASQEVVEGILQNLTALGLYNPDVEVLAGIEREAAVAGTVGAIVGAIIPGRQAIQRRDAMDAANESAKASKLNERLPKKAAEHAGAAMRAEGVDNVSITASAVQEYFQSNEDTDPTAWLRQMGVDPDEYAEALATGGDVSVTPEAYAQHIFGTDNYQSFRDHLRFGDEAWTAAEAEEWIESGLQEELAQYAEDFANLPDTAAAEVTQIQAEVEDMVRAAGMPADAEYAAVLTAQRYATRAQRAGVSPMELWRRDNLSIVGEDQARPFADDLSITLDKARSTDPETFLKLSPTPMQDILIARGGVDPESALGQELRQVGANKRGLFKPGGMGAADNLVASELDGLFGNEGYADEQAIIDAVSEEVAGNPRRTPDEQAQLEAFRGDVDNLVSMLEDAGLTLDSPESEIRAAVAERMGGRQYDQPAYHGTPHRFDRFSLDAIGTGEGAQAYGWGLYFAGKREVAEFYRDALANQQPAKVEIDGETDFAGNWADRLFQEVQDRPNPADDQGLNTLGEISASYTGFLNAVGDFADGREMRGEGSPDWAPTTDYYDAGYQVAKEVLAEKGAVRREPGTLYTVDIPEDGDYLLWDAPLSEQPEGVREKLLAVIPKDNDYFDKVRAGTTKFTTGSDIYESYANYMVQQGVRQSDAPRFVSEEFAAAGIPGIKYLDGGSRSDGDGTYNYVIFDENLVNIIEFEQDNRGSISFTRDATVIRLGANADRSTFLHESGHLFLEQLAADAREFGTPQLVGDWNTVREWWAGNAASIRQEAIGYAKKANDSEAVESLTNMADADVARVARLGDLYGDSFAQSAVSPFTWNDDGTISLKTTATERAFIESFMENEANRDELMEAVPSLRVDGGALVFSQADVDSFGDFILDTKVLDGAITVPPRFRKFFQDGTPGPDRNVIAYLGRAMHEQWARGAEDYFRTGQAPSVALQDAFNRFRAWLVSIYRAMRGRGLDVQFSDDVRAVMDRLLATDEEIELIEQQFNMRAMFGSAEEIGMTPKAFEAYQRAVSRANEEARTRQLKKHLNEVEREQRQWWMDESAKMREETIAPAVHDRPVYKALYGLTRGTLPNGEDIPGGLRPSRLDRNAVIAVLENKESLARLPKVRGKAVYTTSKKEGGAHPDVIAQMYGYEDGRSLLMDLMNAAPMDEVIQRETEAAMKAKHGDMLNDGTAEAEAIEATHNDRRGEVIATELNALRESQPKMKVSFIRQWAKERIGTRKIDDIKPARFLSAERKAGREAGKLLRAGDRLGAQRAKFRQLLNFYMAREAYRVRDEVSRQRKYLQKFVAPKATFKGIDADYVDQIRGILEAYNFAPRLSDAKRQRLMEWAEEQRADGAVLEIPPEIAAADGRTHYRDLTLDEWRTLHDTIRNIEAQGRNAKTTLVEGEERQLDEMAEEINRALDDLPQNQRVARKAVEQHPGAYDRTLGKLAGFDASLRKVEFLTEKMGESAHKYIFQTFADAEAAKNDLVAATSRKIMDAASKLPNKGGKVYVPLLNRNFRRSDLIMMALNTGNESNYDKMLRGSAMDVAEGSVAWTEEGVDEALSNLTEEEWAFVQTVWDSFEAMYPAVEAVYRRENGVAPERIEARPITTRWGQELRGGYFPMIYDPTRSEAAQAIEGKSALEAMQSPLVRGSVYSGMTKARTGFAAPVSLDITQLLNHIEKTAHFVTHYEAVRSSNRLLKRIKRATINKMGQEYYDAIRNWVGDVAAAGQPTNPTDMIGRIVETMRTNATVAIMGFSYTTMASQLLGYANTVDALSRTPDGGYNPLKGTKWLVTGMVQYLRNPAAAKRMVFEASGEMRHRFENTDRDVRHGLRQLAGKSGAWQQMQRFSLMGIAGAQVYMVDFPTWLGAYNRALSEGMTADEAVKNADSVLRMSQTAGGVKDLAAIQRAPGTTRALTMFYSYFNLLYNLQAQAIGNVKGARDVPQLAARAFVLMMLPTALEAMMRQEWPEDDEDYGWWVATRSALYGAASIPLLRDLVGMVEGFGYSVSPLDSFGESLGRSVAGVARAFDDGEMDEATVKALIGAVGFGFGAPVTQLNRFVDAYFGDDAGPYDFLVGYKEK